MEWGQSQLGEAGAHFLVVATFSFVMGALALGLAGLNPAWREKVRGLWPAYRTEFAIVGAFLVPAALGGWFFLAVLLLLCWRGQWELFRLFDLPGFGAVQAVALAVGGIIVAASGFTRIEPLWAAGFLGLIAVLCLAMAAARIRLGLAAFLSLIFPALCLSLVGEIRGGQSFAWVALVYATVEMNDAFAFVGGKLFGRTRILPRLSPKKTLEGLICGMAMGGLTGFLIGRYVLDLEAGTAFCVAMVALLAGLFGDVLTSLLKRWRGKKDFPSVLADHGGVLDIYDSLLIATPVLFLTRGLFL